jgi:hypothetical protein
LLGGDDREDDKMDSVVCLKCGFTNSSFAENCERCRTPLITDNFGLTNLYAQLDRLIDPLETIFRQINPEIDATAVLCVNLLRISGHIASLDKDLSDKEARMIWEMYYNLTHNPDINNLDFHELGNSLRRMVEATPEDFDNVLDEPIIFVRALLTHDSLYGTNYGTTAKAMMLRFANFVAKADGKITIEESEALVKLKAHLDSQTAFPTEETKSDESQATGVAGSVLICRFSRDGHNLFARLTSHEPIAIVDQLLRGLST